MSASSTFHFLVLLVLFLGVEGKSPQACKHYECPSYKITNVGNDYEIRSYDSPVWISTNPINESSLVGATISGFHRLFSYVLGNNTYKKIIKMTSPVTSEVLNSGGSSSIIVSLYVSKENQANPPLGADLNIQRWKTTNVAVRQFGGFVTDYKVEKEVAALKNSLASTKWSSTPKSYIVAQYNAPFELFNRVNEIWFLYP